MKKIRLNIDDLSVTSFTASAGTSAGRRGTVRGAATGYTCYVTVAYDRRTNCLAYVESYWGEDTCTCPIYFETDPRICPVPDTAQPTCVGLPGC